MKLLSYLTSLHLTLCVIASNGEQCSLCYNSEKPSNPENNYLDPRLDANIHNCTDEYVIYWGDTIPASSVEDCSYAQTQTYLQCGCPSLPPLLTDSPTPPDDACTLCADGSDPQNPDASLTPSHTNQTSWTCQALVNEFPYKE